MKGYRNCFAFVSLATLILTYPCDAVKNEDNSTSGKTHKQGTRHKSEQRQQRLASVVTELTTNEKYTHDSTEVKSGRNGLQDDLTKPERDQITTKNTHVRSSVRILQSFEQLTDNNIQGAVDLFLENQADANAKYGNISTWDTSRVTNMSYLFSSNRNLKAADFDEDISRWNTARVTKMKQMFRGASSFSHSLRKWDVRSVIDMSGLLQDASQFDKSLGSWDTSSNIHFQRMFFGAVRFNRNLSSWNVEKGRDFSHMFRNASKFDKEINFWKMKNALDTTAMFREANRFNQMLDSWSMAKVTRTKTMFKEAKRFNQDISSWAVGSVTDMINMFQGASSFNQELCSWGAYLVKDTTVQGMFQNSGCQVQDSPDLNLAPFPGPFCTVCSCDCVPWTFEWTLDFSLTCQKPFNIRYGELTGIADAHCDIYNRFHGNGIYNSTIPVNSFVVKYVQILELDLLGNTIEHTMMQETEFRNGDSFSYNRKHSSTFMQLAIGVDANDTELVMTWVVKYRQSCDIKSFSVNDSLGWTVFTNVAAKSALCLAGD